jgi:hypothetical protein
MLCPAHEAQPRHENSGPYRPSVAPKSWGSNSASPINITRRCPGPSDQIQLRIPNRRSESSRNLTLSVSSRPPNQIQLRIPNRRSERSRNLTLSVSSRPPNQIQLRIPNRRPSERSRKLTLSVSCLSLPPSMFGIFRLARVQSGIQRVIS